MSARTKKVGVFPRNFDWANWITIEARNVSPAPPLQAVRSVSFEGLAKTSQINLIYQWEQDRPVVNSFCPEALRPSKAMHSEGGWTHLPGRLRIPRPPEGVGWSLAEPHRWIPWPKQQLQDRDRMKQWTGTNICMNLWPQAQHMLLIKRGCRWGEQFLKFLPRRESVLSSYWEENANIHDKAWAERTTKYFNKLSPHEKEVIFPSEGHMDGCTLAAWCSSNHLFRLL